MRQINKNHLIIFALLLIPTVLLILPADYFDEGRAVCLSVLLLGQTCPGCGITRAIMHLLHFDIDSAYYYNPLSFIVLPAMIGLWFIWMRDAVRNLSA